MQHITSLVEIVMSYTLEHFKKYPHWCKTLACIAPNTNKKLITCVGCSFTFDLASSGRSYPDFLGKLLGDEYDVINLGRAGAGILQSTWLHLAYIAKHHTHPYGTVFQVTDCFRRPRPELDKKQNTLELYSNKGMLGELLKGIISESYLEKQFEYIVSKEMQRIFSHFDMLIRGGTKLLVLIYTGWIEGFRYLHKYATASMLRLFYDLVKDKCDKKNISYIEVQPKQFKGMTTNCDPDNLQPELHGRSGHLLATGTKALAGEIYGKFKDILATEIVV